MVKFVIISPFGNYRIAILKLCEIYFRNIHVRKKGNSQKIKFFLLMLLFGTPEFQLMLS